MKEPKEPKRMDTTFVAVLPVPRASAKTVVMMFVIMILIVMLASSTDGTKESLS